MNFKFEIPEETLVIKRTDLEETLRELIGELQESSLKEEIMTIKQAAEYLKVSIPTVRTLIANKEIPYFQRGQVIRINRNDLKAWIRKNSREKVSSR